MYLGEECSGAKGFSESELSVFQEEKAGRQEW